jgi:hypothetical protein
MTTTRGRLVRRALLLGAGVLALVATAGRPARAQWGWGYGGWGFGGGQIGNMAIMNNINDRSAAAASAAYAARQTMPGVGRVYANNPNSYINRTRDATFFERFDPSTRRSMSQQMSRLPAASASVAAPTRPAGAATGARAVMPLASFFSAAGALVWPAGAPTDGPLGSQQAAADSSVTAVYRETQAGGRAPVGLVTDARTALIAYGQPALDQLRTHTTPAVVDGFHRFLLSLYDSLGQAALGTATGPR